MTLLKALCHPYPTTQWKIEKWGYDGKQLSHLMRLFFFLCALDDKGELTKDVYYPAQDVAEDLIIVKKNKLDAPFDMVLKTADDFCQWTKDLVDNMLQKEWKEPNLGLLDELLIKVLRMYFKEDILGNE